MMVPWCAVRPGPATVRLLQLLLLQGGMLSWAQNSCLLEAGKCVYEVRLSTDCQHSKQLDYNSLQNDYDQRVNQIEQNLVDVRVDHARRLEDLENRISVLVTPETHDPHTGRSMRPGKAHRHHSKFALETIKQTEDELLMDLHGQFQELRHELGSCRDQQRSCQAELHESRRQHNKTRLALLQTTSKLSHADDELARAKDEQLQVVQDLQQKDGELNDTQARLTDMLKQLRNKELDLWDLEFQNGRMKKELRDLRALLARTRQHLADALRKYHELNLAHEQTVQILRNTSESLDICFKGKTSQFCGFEDENICGFEADNSSSSELQWLWHHGYTPSARTGPEQDHTCKNRHGYYMYVEASNRGQAQKATLVSPRYGGLEQQCVEFYYHMYGRHTGTLNVYTRTTEEDFVRAWRAFGNQGDVWSSARLPIPEEVARKGYQVIFEGLPQKGFEGDIAVDDFRVFDGGCYEMPANSTEPAATQKP